MGVLLLDVCLHAVTARATGTIAGHLLVRRFASSALNQLQTMPESGRDCIQVLHTSLGTTCKVNDAIFGLDMATWQRQEEGATSHTSHGP